MRTGSHYRYHTHPGRLVLALIAALSFVSIGCGPDQDRPKATDQKPTVLVSVAPQAYFVERVAGDRVTVEILIPPGASPHTHEPTIDQMKSISRASIYLTVGHPHFHFEEVWLQRILAENETLVIVNGTGAVETLDSDPHVWLSPIVARAMAEGIASELGDRYPADREFFEANLSRFLADVDAVDGEIRTALAPYHGTRLFVFHAAWGYFAREYGLEQLSVLQGSREPGPQRLAEILESARDAQLSVLFVQPQYSSRNAEQIGAELGIEVVTVDPLARDWLQNLKTAADAFVRAGERRR